MAYDGSIKIDTKIDSTGFSSGIAKLKSIAKTGCAAVATSVAAVTTGVVTAGTAAVKVGSSFEAAMSKVSAISGATGKDLETLTAKAKEMGAKTKFSASESAEAFQYMAMAGWDTNSMLGGIDGIMSLAAADGLDLATTSDIVTDALTAFGLKASDSTHFADVLAKTSSSANTNVSMLGESFKYVAPLAGTMGYSVEDVSLALGLMANASVKGSMAGTSLKTALSNLAAPTEQMQSVMTELGISMTDAQGNALPLADVLKELRTKFGTLSDTEKTAAASTLFGKEAMSGMLAIINASDSDFKNLTENIDNADGSAQSMADTMQDNLQGQFTVLKSSLEGLGIEIYEGMQEPLTNAAKEAINYVNQLTEAFKKDGLSGLIKEAGNIFGELATKAAEQAPKMVDVAVSFIASFVDSLGKNANKIASAGVSIIETLIKGVSDNIGKLAKAAKSIVKALVDNLVKLLPNEVQKPVKECINTLTKSFENGGLKKAINTVKTIISNLGKIITNVAKVVLPPLAKAVDLVADNLNVLLPVVVAVYTAYKSYQIISTITGIITAHTAAVTAESLAQAASLGTITLKQIAVGALTGEISLATAAQYAWNLAMSLNPIGIVVAAVAGLIAIITALNVCNSDILSSEEELKISKENLAKANEDLGNSYNGVADGLNNFESNIDSASSCLDGFDDSVIISKDKQQELADKMQNVQKQITDIATTATEERRNLNQNEIDRLDELFAKQKDLANQEQEVQQGRQKAVKDIAEDTAANHDMSLEEYEEYATKYIKSAEDERDATVDAAEKTKINVLAEKKALIGKSSEYTTEWYNKQREQAQKDYDKSVSEANKVCGDTLSVVKKGYEDRAGALKKYQKNQSDYAKKTEDEQDRHNGRLGILYHNMNDSLEKCQDESGKTQSEIQKKYQKLINEENAKYNNNISKSKKEFSKTIDKDQEHQLGYWIEILGHTETYGGKITKSDKQTVKDIDAIFDTLPKGTTQAMNNAMQGMIDNIEERSPELYAKIANQADTVLSIYKKHWDEHSPSKATKKIFKFLISGGELGFDEETPKLYRQTEKIADTIKDKLSNKISADFIVSKMRTAVFAGQSALTSQLTANVIHDVNVQTSEQDKKVIATGNIVTHMDVNGREFAVATTPYISEELAWEDR